jgi:autotransporter-associated beta strand protein
MLVFVGLLLAAVSVSGQYIATNVWTGLGTNGWREGLAPANSGAVVFLGNSVNPTVTFSYSVTDVNAFLFGDGQDYTIATSDGSQTIGLTGGIVGTGTYGGRAVFDSYISLNLSGTPAFDAGPYTLVVEGQLVGSTTSPLKLTSSTGTGGFIFNNTGMGNTYTGGTQIYSFAAGPTYVAFWSSSPFGSDPVTITNSANLIAHNTLQLTNNLTLNHDANASNATLYVKSWDDKLTFTGAVTLGSNAAIVARGTSAHVAAAGNQGVFPLPGANSYNPVIFSGDIGETNAGTSLAVNGAAPVILTGTNTYTGGTTVNGSLVFGTASAAPATGSVTVNTSGFVGLGDPTVVGANGLTAFVAAHVNPASSGAVGIDTVPGYSGGTLISTEPLNLSSSTGNGLGGAPLGFTNASIRIGAASEVYLSYPFVLTPQGTNYQFGNGGGTIYYQSPLTDTAGNGDLVAGRALTMTNNNAGAPLKLYLQGANYSYTGGTVANNGFIIFDSTNANGIPTTGLFTAAGASNNTGGSYIGYTSRSYLYNNRGPADSSAFLALFDKANTWGIIGFDTPFDYTQHLTGDVNLTGFNNGVFLGTASYANINGALTPTADGIMRFTAGNGGSLSVSSALTAAGGITGVVLGSPAANEAYSNGTIYLSGANTYTGGTTINTNGGLTVEADNANAFGTGTVNLAAGNGAVVGLQAGTAGLILANNFSFQAPGTNQSAATLAFTGTNAFTLSGSLSGQGSLSLLKATTDLSPLQVTLSGNNSAFTGDITLQNSTLVLGSSNATGQAPVTFEDSAALLQTAPGLTAATLYGIKGDAGRIYLPATGAFALTIDTSNPNSSHEFGGYISGPGLVTTDATLTVTAAVNLSAKTEFLYLYAYNYYTGDTFITGQAALALGNSNSAGTGTIHINATDGGLAINRNVLLTNALDFQNGGLGGVGTFAPTSVNGVPGAPIAFGTNQKLFPGIPGDKDQMPGTLTFNTGVVFATGGTLEWLLQDGGRTDGFSSVLINGNLDITATAGAFKIDLHSIDASGADGLPQAFDPFSVHTWTIVTASGTITGFNPADFTFDASKFYLGTLSASQFSLSLGTANTLVLNYAAAVPEPSTYALFALGLGLVGLAVRRRRA